MQNELECGQTNKKFIINNGEASNPRSLSNVTAVYLVLFMGCCMVEWLVVWQCQQKRNFSKRVFERSRDFVQIAARPFTSRRLAPFLSKRVTSRAWRAPKTAASRRTTGRTPWQRNSSPTSCQIWSTHIPDQWYKTIFAIADITVPT